MKRNLIHSLLILSLLLVTGALTVGCKSEDDASGYGGPVKTADVDSTSKVPEPPEPFEG